MPARVSRRRGEAAAKAHPPVPMRAGKAAPVLLTMLVLVVRVGMPARVLVVGPSRQRGLGRGLVSLEVGVGVEVGVVRLMCVVKRARCRK